MRWQIDEPSAAAMLLDNLNRGVNNPLGESPMQRNWERTSRRQDVKENVNRGK